MKYYLKIGVALMLLGMAFAASAAVGPLEDGIAAYDKRDYATTLTLL